MLQGRTTESGTEIGAVEPLIACEKDASAGEAIGIITLEVLVSMDGVCCARPYRPPHHLYNVGVLDSIAHWQCQVPLLNRHAMHFSEKLRSLAACPPGYPYVQYLTSRDKALQIAHGGACA